MAFKVTGQSHWYTMFRPGLIPQGPLSTSTLTTELFYLAVAPASSLGSLLHHLQNSEHRFPCCNPFLGLFHIPKPKLHHGLYCPTCSGFQLSLPSPTQPSSALAPYQSAFAVSSLIMLTSGHPWKWHTHSPEPTPLPETPPQGDWHHTLLLPLWVLAQITFLGNTFIGTQDTPP